MEYSFSLPRPVLLTLCQVPAGMTIAQSALTVDVESRMATVHGAPAHLTPTEWNLLTFFLRNRGRVVTHEVLAERVWCSALVDRTVIKAAVRRLRAKLGDESATPTLIHTHRGTGYRFTDDGGADYTGTPLVLATGTSATAV